MYDEFERAVTGKPAKKGMGFLGWIGAGLLFVAVAGVVGVGFAINRAFHEVEHLARDFEMGSGLAGLAMLSNLESQTELISMDPEEGLAFLLGMESGDPSSAFLGEMMEGTFDLARIGKATRERRVQRVGGDDDVKVNLDRSDDGGSLVINAGGEQISFNLVRNESGGFLTIDSDDGHTRIDLVGNDEGGYLSIDSDEGNVRFDLKKNDEGGELLIQTDDETVRLGVGDDAQDMPGWVPAFDGMPPRPRPVYSLDSSDGLLGAVAWDGDESPSEVLAFYRAELESQGYELRDSYRRTGDDADEGSFWARNQVDDRMVFVVATREHGETKVLLGYGEKR
jgi:hypothetical protein